MPHHALLSLLVNPEIVWTLNEGSWRPGVRKTSRLTSTRTKTAQPYVGEDTELPSDRRCDCGDPSVPLEGGKRLACWLCRYQERKNHDRNNKAINKISWACSKCDRPLCLNDDQNCFVQFHKLWAGGVASGAYREVADSMHGANLSRKYRFTTPKKR